MRLHRIDRINRKSSIRGTIDCKCLRETGAKPSLMVPADELSELHRVLFEPNHSP